MSVSQPAGGGVVVVFFAIAKFKTFSSIRGVRPRRPRRPSAPSCWHYHYAEFQRATVI